MTSTMKSPPGRSVVNTSTVDDGSVSRAGVGALADVGAGPCGTAAFVAPGTSAAAPAVAPVTAALLRKPRRSTESLLDIGRSLHPPQLHLAPRFFLHLTAKSIAANFSASC